MSEHEKENKPTKPPTSADSAKESINPEEKEETMPENTTEKVQDNTRQNDENGDDNKKPETPVDKKALKEQFEAFAKFGDKSADGKTIKLSQSDKWFKQAKVIEPKRLSTTDTGIAFRKISK